MNKYLSHYLIAVEHPDVSGFEILEMLLVRDKLAERYELLTAGQKNQLAVADQRLIEQAPQFYAELTLITSLETERQNRQTTPKQWWWYLDVIVYLPVPRLKVLEPMVV